MRDGEGKHSICYLGRVLHAKTKLLRVDTDADDDNEQDDDDDGDNEEDDGD